jgi:carbamoyltransferase
MEKMNYIGISAGFHDASLSVIRDGEILFAGHNERYSGIKNDKIIGPELVRDALQYVNGDYELHYYERPLLKYLRQLRSGERPSLYNLFPQTHLTRGAYTNLGKKKIHTHSHHLSHAAAGFQTSNFVDATVVIVDAIGEFDTVSIWDARYDNNHKAVYKKIYSKKYPDSLGLFYSALTQRVGLKPNEEEYITMGMAAYGESNYYSDMHFELLNNSYDLEFKDNLHLGFPSDFLPHVSNEDLASSGQVLLENLLKRIMQRAKVNGYSRNLVYGGGVALNCLANRFLGDYFENIWIMPNPGDAGSSLGCAALAYGHRVNWRNSFLGYDIPGSYPVNGLLDRLFIKSIVGVASGRAEFGPRALGNRSLLADPRGSEIKEKVNEIKRRQKFRPFAPVILEEYVHNYFNMPLNWRDSRYMQTIATCRFPKLFPAIVHVDGSSRVQTVPKDGSGIRELLEKWFVLTGCPMLLNTSLNIRGEPMVNNRLDADRFEIQYNIEVLS